MPQRVFDVVGPELTLSESLNLFHPHRKIKIFRFFVLNSDQVTAELYKQHAHTGSFMPPLTGVRQKVNYL